MLGRRRYGSGLTRTEQQPVPEKPSSSLFMRLGPSRQLALLLGAAHLGAIPCVFASDLPLFIQGVVGLGIVLAGFRCIALHGTRRSLRAIVLLSWDRGGQWRMLQRDGRVLDARLAQGAYAHPRLLVLPFRCHSGRRLCVLIAPDTMEADGLRRLRVRLRCQRQEDA